MGGSNGASHSSNEDVAMLCCIHLCQDESWFSLVFRDRRIDLF